MIGLIFICVLSLVGCGLPGNASSQPSQIAVEDAWARPTVGLTNAVGGVYLVIENMGGPDKLTGISGDVAAMSSVHETKDNNGMMQMNEVQGGLEIPANSTVTLKPGGLHIMMMDMKQELKAGDTFKLTLKFQSGKDIPVDVTVRDE